MYPGNPAPNPSEGYKDSPQTRQDITHIRDLGEKGIKQDKTAPTLERIKMDRATTIISFNCDNNWLKIEQIAAYIYRNRPAVALLQDPPKLELELIINEFKDSCGYLTNQENIGQHTDILTLYNSRETISAKRIASISSNDKTCASIDTIKLKSTNTPITLVNLYIRPRHPNSHTIQLFKELETIIKTAGASRTIIMGDVNSISQRWCPQEQLLRLNDQRINDKVKTYRNIQVTRGRLINNLVDKLKLNCLNNIQHGPSYTDHRQTKTEAYIDIIMAGSKAQRSWSHHSTRTLDKSPGHKIITIIQRAKTNIDNQQQLRRQYTTQKRRRQLKDHNLPPNIDKHRDEMKLINSRIDTNDFIQLRPKEIETMMNNLTNILHQYLLTVQEYNKRQHHRNHKRRKNKRAPMIPSKSQLIKKYHKELDKIIKDKTKASTWDKIKAFKAIKPQTMTANQNNNKDNDQTRLHNILNEKFPHIDRTKVKQLATNTQDRINNDDHEYLIPETEILNAIKEIRNKRHTGPEGIKFSTFNQELEHTYNIVAKICKISLYIGKLPTQCLTGLGRLIEKKQPGKFRIVHLSTPLLSLIEQITLHHLESTIEKKKLIDEQQYGFTANRDRHDLVSELIRTTVQNKITRGQRAITTVVSLDIKGAFDNIDHHALISKLHKDLGKTHLTVRWITDLLLHKKIILELNGIRSQPRPICQGVPQGSSLGPILWNFALEDTTTKLNRQYKNSGLVILSYADDLIMIQHNTRMKALQAKLNMLIHELGKLGLELSAEKSSIYHIHNKRKMIPTGELKIANTIIPCHNTLNILGLSLNKNLKLDRNSIDSNAKLKENIRMLSQVQQMGIITSASEWQDLINSYIRSILITNNYPILAIDPTDRTWLDKYLIKVYRHIFDWPQNSSCKAIRLLTHQKSIESEVRLLTYKKLWGRQHMSHKMLDMILDSNLAIMREDIPNELILELTNIESPYQTTSYYTNPRHYLSPRTKSHSDHKFMSIIDKGDRSILVELQYNNLVKVETGTCWEYRTSYYNSLALLNKKIDLLATSAQQGVPTLAMTQSNSLYQALINYRTHKREIIELRKRLYEHGWSIIIIEESEYRDSVTRKTFAHLETLAQIGQLDRIKHWHISQPYLSRYKTRNGNKKRLLGIVQKEHKSNLTNFCNSITTDHEAWQHINPGWVSGKRLLMLSGMTSHNGQLTHIDQTQQCPECRQNPVNMALHKAFLCDTRNKSEYDPRTLELEEDINSHTGHLGQLMGNILKDKFKQQTLLRALSKHTFPSE